MNDRPKSYSWDNPNEWLTQHADGMGEDELRSVLRLLARDVLTSDDIQDLFQDEMEAAGYFRDAPDLSSQEGQDAYFETRRAEADAIAETDPEAGFAAHRALDHEMAETPLPDAG